MKLNKNNIREGLYYFFEEVLEALEALENMI
jgi:hypothetical protein